MVIQLVIGAFDRRKQCGMDELGPDKEGNGTFGK
jgi:hypothetical protein